MAKSSGLVYSVPHVKEKNYPPADLNFTWLAI